MVFGDAKVNNVRLEFAFLKENISKISEIIFRLAEMYFLLLRGLVAVWHENRVMWNAERIGVNSACFCANWFKSIYSCDWTCRSLVHSGVMCGKGNSNNRSKLHSQAVFSPFSCTVVRQVAPKVSRVNNPSRVRKDNPFSWSVYWRDNSQLQISWVS